MFSWRGNGCGRRYKGGHMFHAHMIAKALRTLADTIELTPNPKEFRRTYIALERVREILNIVSCNYQRKLLQGAAYDLDQNEIQRVYENH